MCAGDQAPARAVLTSLGQLILFDPCCHTFCSPDQSTTPISDCRIGETQIVEHIHDICVEAPSSVTRSKVHLLRRRKSNSIRLTWLSQQTRGITVALSPGNSSRRQHILGTHLTRVSRYILPLRTLFTDLLYIFKFIPKVQGEGT